MLQTYIPSLTGVCLVFFSAQFMLRKFTLSALLTADLSLLKDSLPGIAERSLTVSGTGSCIFLSSVREQKKIIYSKITVVLTLNMKN